MIVADTNLITYFLIKSQYSDEAERVFLKDPEWSVPRFWRSEFRSVLFQYMRHSSFSIARSMVIMESAEFLIGTKEFDVSSSDVFSLAPSSTCSAYDCEFVALAVGLGVPLVTYDRRLLSEFPSVAISARSFIES